MARNRNSSFWLLLWAGLLFLSLRPVALVDHALDVLLVPLRLAAELGRPLDLLNRRGVSAAERDLARAAPEEAAAGAATLLELAEQALPRDPELVQGRHFVPAEVLERKSSDECWVAASQSLGVVRGAPVVCGDVYVGRVVEVRPGATTLARVQLVTAAGFRVGAIVHGEKAPSAKGETDSAATPSEEPRRDGDPVYLVVGGVRVPRRGSHARVVRLAAHQPSAPELHSGLVRVHELFADVDDSGGLAEGFRLGELRREGERDLAWIEPELDYLDGLFHVAIVRAIDAPESGLDALVGRAPHALTDGQWLATRALTPGDPSPWRSTLKVPLGTRQDVRPGAAVTGAGARLVGRILRVGLVSSDVALLADPGLTLAVVARIEGPLVASMEESAEAPGNDLLPANERRAPDGAPEEDLHVAGEPRILGRLTSLGRGSDGAIRMRWSVRVPLDLGAGGAPTVRARLYTGSGEPGVPGGLVLGAAELPGVVRAGEEHELELDPGLDPAAVRRLFVRRESEGARP